MKHVSLTICLACVLCCSGCFTRTVYIPDGKAVRLRQEITAKVWVLDKDLIPIPGKMTLQEGWWVLPDPVPVTEPPVDEPTPSESIVPHSESKPAGEIQALFPESTGVMLQNGFVFGK